MTWNNFHGGIELRAPEFRWPGGKRIAVILRVALEGWSDGHAPGSGPMANPLKSGFLDLNSISWAEYGPRRGIHHILDILAKRKVQVSVLVCGIMAERYPTIVKKIAEAGHEIVAHSYTMDVIPPYLSESEERKNIAQTTDLLEQISGIRPNGWISPRATASTNTARLLAEAGYEWHGDYLDDDVPYGLKFGNRTIIASPASPAVADGPTHIRHGFPPRAVLEVFEDTLESLRRHGGMAEKIDIAAHAHIFGRPEGLWVIDRILEIASSADDIWITTRGKSAAHIRNLLQT